MELVSVVIPTTRRPVEVVRAVRSVLAQSHEFFEVIVVIDGPNAATVDALAAVSDSRLRTIENAQSIGAGAARNAGAAAARGGWIAFLDDDDEWLPEKLATQLEGVSAADDVFLTCRCRVKTARRDYVWPRLLHDGREPVDEYLFGRKRLLRGEAYIGTSSMVLPARLFAQIPFGQWHQNEDTTLLLQATKRLGARIVMAPEVLATVHTEDDRGSLSSVFSWRAAVDWLDEMGPLIGPRAYSGFCLVTVVSQAVRARDYTAPRFLLARAFRRGQPTPVQLALFFTFWVVPIRVRQRLRAILSTFRGSIQPRAQS